MERHIEPLSTTKQIRGRIMRIVKFDKDFRDNIAYESVADCKFCYENIKSQIIEEFNSVVVIKDNNPVSKDHCLVVPKRHSPDYFSMTTVEKMDSDYLLRIQKNRIYSSDSKVTGFNIGMNCGESAGQTIFDAHIHLIPIRDGDTPNPSGGVRGVIPDQMDY